MLLNRRSMVVFCLTALVACLGLSRVQAGEGDDAKAGTATGVVTAKGKDFIKVKGEGDKEPRQYMPEWKGGNPDAGGGLDKEILAKIATVPVGSVVKVTWKQDEHLRVTAIEVIKKGEGEHRDGDRREHRDGDRRENRENREKHD
jgi:hypothetical protein